MTRKLYSSPIFFPKGNLWLIHTEDGLEQITDEAYRRDYIENPISASFDPVKYVSISDVETEILDMYRKNYPEDKAEYKARQHKLFNMLMDMKYQEGDFYISSNKEIINVLIDIILAGMEDE